MIAGEGIVGILLAIFAVAKLDGKINLSGIYGDNFKHKLVNWVALVAFALLVGHFSYSAEERKHSDK